MKSLFSRLFPPRRPAQLHPRDLAKGWIILGLGNPGPEYAHTRHNVGYRVIDLLRADAPWRPVAGAPLQVCQLSDATLARSTTYMNDSGLALAPLAAAGLPAERVIVVHDELDLPPGRVRLRRGGGENGHNGLKSLSAVLESRDYLRVRVGIGRPARGESVPDYVLGSSPDTPALHAQLALAATAVQRIVAEGLVRAQNEIHASESNH